MCTMIQKRVSKYNNVYGTWYNVFSQKNKVTLDYRQYYPLIGYISQFNQLNSMYVCVLRFKRVHQNIIVYTEHDT